MTGTDNVALRKVIVQVGNPSRGEQLKLSLNPLTLNDARVRALLTKHFPERFNENEFFQFTHLSELRMNEVYNYVPAFFDDENSF